MERATIVGCGWVGLALAKRWVQRGIDVTGTTTRATRLDVLESAGVRALRIEAQSTWDALPSVSELLVITVPPGRRHPERVAVYPQRLTEVAGRADPGAKVIYLSSTGVYGDARGRVDEETLPAPVTNSARAVLDAEQRLRSMLGGRLTVLRLGGLVGPDRHPGRWFAGKQDAPNGDAPVNLVHRDDVLDAIDAVVDHDAFGLVLNVVAAEHPTKRAYYTAVCDRFGFDPPTFRSGGDESKVVVADPMNNLLLRRIELPFYAG